ncbi:MAG: DUF3800 domain-containing protein [Muribaculaceae bacterium]|nr:DUF3800 domain-containing protein [Muribaculaceae bacterium]
MEINDKKIHYTLFIDESGDPNLEQFDTTFPLFTLCGVLINDKKLHCLENEIQSLKRELWGSEDVIFHSREIRNCGKVFVKLLDNKIKERFYTRINEILGQEDVYSIVCCCILKEPFVERFNTGEDVYGLSLKYLIERAIFHIDDCENGNAKLRIIVERRNPKQNSMLLKYYNGLRVKGTKWITPERLIDRIKSLSFAYKRDNVIGLQVADLIAYPISRHVLNPERPNPAFDVIARNIYTYKGAQLGLKIIPH